MKRLKRLKVIAATLAVAVVALLVAGYTALTALDLESYRGEIERRAEAATGREVALSGAMDLQVGLSPAVAVEQASFANAEWGSRPEMVKVRRFEVEVALLPLLTGDLQVTRLVLVEPEILLEIGPEGQGNWALGQPEETPAGDGGEAGSLPAISGVRIENAHVLYKDAESGLDLELTVANATLEQAEGGKLAVDADGAYQGVPFTASGTIGALPQLMAAGGGYPLDLAVETDRTTLRLAGTLDQSGRDIAPDVDLDLQAESLAAFEKLAGAQLPDVGPLALKARARSVDGAYRFSGIQADLAGSDLAGEATVSLAGDRPRLEAKLSGSTLDLTPFTGGGSAADGRGGGDGRVFPDTPLPLDLLKRADAEVKLKAGTVRLTDKLSASELSLALSLDEGRLKLAPLETRVAGGSVKLDGALDAAAAPAAMTVDLDAAEIDYGRLLEDLGIADSVQGTTAVRFDLKGRGDSPRALAGSLSGGIEVVGGKGRIAEDALGAAGASLGDLTKLWREEGSDMNLNCAVARFGVDQGVAESRAILADTEKVSFGGTGSIDLGQERYDLRITPEAKQTSLMSLAVPVRVTGPLTDPAIGPDPLGAAKATAFVVGAAINPLVAVGALVVSSETTEQNPCVAALAKAREGGTPSGGAGSGAGGAESGVKGFLDEMGDSIDDTLGTEGGSGGGGDGGSSFPNDRNNR